MRFFNLYQFIAPVVLLPVSYGLWLQRLAGDHRLVLLVLSVPVMFAYVNPAIGANRLGLWEIRTRLRVGKIRPHHGLVFGSATALIALVCTDPPGTQFGPLALVRGAVVLGSVLGFWNWFYDMEAIRAGFLVVYNKPFADGRGPEAIAADFSPVYFFTFGACYGIAIAVDIHLLLVRGQWEHYGTLLVTTNVAGLALPVLVYVLWTWLRRGESGLRPHPAPDARKSDQPQASSMLQ